MQDTGNKKHEDPLEGMCEEVDDAQEVCRDRSVRPAS